MPATYTASHAWIKPSGDVPHPDAYSGTLSYGNGFGYGSLPMPGFYCQATFTVAP